MYRASVASFQFVTHCALEFAKIASLMQTQRSAHTAHVTAVLLDEIQKQQKISAVTQKAMEREREREREQKHRWS